jgi:SAM-dependent methyltransferase
VADRLDVWDSLDDYPAEVYSLWHQTGGGSLHPRIQKLAPHGICADFGCGPGYWLSTLSGAQVIHAVDFSQNMLDQAASRAPEQTQFHLQSLSALTLPDPVDFALCLNAVMPESHCDALQILSGLANSLAKNGRLLLVLPSMESLLFVANMQHFDAAARGEEEQSLLERMELWSQWYSNPLGYVRNGNGTVVKYWLKDEAEAVFKQLGMLKVVDHFQLERGRTVSGETPPVGVKGAWFWGWVLERVHD